MNSYGRYGAATASAEEPFFDRRGMVRVCSRLGLAFLCMLAAYQLVGGLAIGLMGRYFPAAAENSWVVWALNDAALYLVAFPLFLLLIRPLPVYPRRPGPPFTGPQAAAIVFICFAVTYLANMLSSLVVLLLGLLRGESVGNPITDFALEASPFSNLVFGVIIAPIMEEITFRGLLLQRVRGYGERFAMVVSGVFFGTFHGNLTQMLYAFLLGMLFAYVTLRTGRLRMAILLHMLINFVGIIVAQQAIAAGVWAILLMGVWVMLCLLTGVVLFLVLRRELFFFPRNPLPLGEGQKLALFFRAPGVLLYLAGILAVVVLGILFT